MTVRTVVPPYPSGFKKVLGSYQSAKNVLTVGATDSAGVIADFSSKGPVKDGRIKPEITSMGKRVVSAGFGSYWYNSGTSMATPGVTGGLTLLYQLYKQINGGSNPKSGLMKAVVCNSGHDIGKFRARLFLWFWLAGSSKGRPDDREQQVFDLDHRKRDTKYPFDHCTCECCATQGHALLE